MIAETEQMPAPASAPGDDVVTAPLDRIQYVEYGDLHPSPTNPRKHYAPAPLQELSNNIQQLGIQTPLHVRHSSTGLGQYEIIAGERRYRANGMCLERLMKEAETAEAADAARLAALYEQRCSRVPVIVKDWNDRQVMEFQLIENLQREDLTPLEEADGYQRLIEAGYTAEDIAKQIGRVPNQVYRALKWVRLPELARIALEEGLIGKEHATLIARIPDERARRWATIEIVYFPDEYRAADNDEDLEEAEKDARKTLKNEPEAIAPMNVKAARELILREFMASLKEVPFKLADAELVAPALDERSERCSGGACLDCPARTGVNPLFAAELVKGTGSGLDPNVCTLPACLRAKMDAHWQREKASAESKGQKILADDEAKKVFSSYGACNLQYGSKYVDVHDKPDYSLTGHANEAKMKQWSTLLKGTDAPIIVARDPRGRTRHLIERSVAVEAVNQKCVAKGEESPFVANAKGNGGDGHDSWKEQQKKQAEEKKRDQRAFALVLKGLGDVVTAKGMDVDAWWLLLDVELHDVGMDSIRLVAQSIGVSPEAPKKGNLDQGHYAAAILEHLKATERSPAEIHGMLVLCAAARNSWQLLDSGNLKKIAGHFGVSIIEAKQVAKDEVKAKRKAKKEKEKKGAQAATGKKKNANAADKTDWTTEGENAKTAAADAAAKNGKVRGIDRYRCDTCNCQLYVPTGMGDTACTLKPGEMQCTQHGGTWKRWWDEFFYAGYHCDRCGTVCAVTTAGSTIERVETMKDGEFQCERCDKESHWEPLPADLQEEYETWHPPAKVVSVEEFAREIGITDEEEEADA